MFHIFFFNSNIYDQYIIRQINVFYQGLHFAPFVILFYFDDILSCVHIQPIFPYTPFFNDWFPKLTYN